MNVTRTACSLAAAPGRWLRDLSPTCREVTRLQSRALDGAPRGRVWLGLKVHLLLCRWCRRYGEQLRFLRDALRHAPDGLAIGVEIRLPVEARERLKETLRLRLAAADRRSGHGGSSGE